MNKFSYSNLIKGRDTLNELGITIKLENMTITWQGVSLSMEFKDFTTKELFIIEVSHPIQNETKQIKLILDAEYKKIDLN